jgi:hypothetical protein
VSGASDYTVQYKTSASSTWITLGTYTTTSTSISGLAASTTYNWQVKASCSTGYSTSGSFTTTAVSTACTAPAGLTTTNVGSNSATLNWVAVPAATSYTIQYRRNTSYFWSNVSNVTGTSRAMNNLSSGKTYQWRIKSNCNSSYSSTVSFTTVNGGMIAMEEGSTTTSIDLYPNPAQNQVHLVVSGWAANETGSAEIFSVTGALLKTAAMNADDNVIETRDLPAGVYFVYVRKEGNEPAVARFVKD